MRTVWLVALLGLGCCYLVNAVPNQALYPFGDDYGDTRLEVEDDVSSSEVILETPMAFYDNRYRTVYVSPTSILLFHFWQSNLCRHFQDRFYCI